MPAILIFNNTKAERTMMNIKQNKGLFALLLLAVLTACTSEDNITTSKQLIEVGGDKLKNCKKTLKNMGVHI